MHICQLTIHYSVRRILKAGSCLRSEDKVIHRPIFENRSVECFHHSQMYEQEKWGKNKNEYLQNEV